MSLVNQSQQMSGQGGVGTARGRLACVLDGRLFGLLPPSKVGWRHGLGSLLGKQPAPLRSQLLRKAGRACEKIHKLTLRPFSTPTSVAWLRFAAIAAAYVDEHR